MQSIRALLRHPLAGPVIRYGIAGGTVAAVYLATPLLLNGVLGVALQVAIPIAYLLAIVLHFNLQRRFVFLHVDEFALTVRQQIGRYAVIGAIQYPTTALATAFLPGLLGISDRVMFVIITLVISGTFFLVLRGHVFHPTVEEELVAEASAGRDLAEREPDPVTS
jgi:putative flippase GtrA